MAGKPGNRIVVDAERVGQAERTGEILEVIERGVSVRYRVRWSDGRETVLTPAGGSARILSDDAAPAGPKPGAASTGARVGPSDREAMGGKPGKAGKQKAKTKKASAGKDAARKKQDKGSGKAKGKRRGGPKAG
jgi:hypothetical protein